MNSNINSNTIPIDNYEKINEDEDEDNNKNQIEEEEEENENEEEKEEIVNEEEIYDLKLPEKYHNQKYKLIKVINTEDGKTINFYDKNKKEIIFKSGVKKEIFYDGYQIIYFTNGDIKQIFPDKTKEVYFFKLNHNLNLLEAILT